jgi:hypothetical protein
MPAGVSRRVLNLFETRGRYFPRIHDFNVLFSPDLSKIVGRVGLITSDTFLLVMASINEGAV